MVRLIWHRRDLRLNDNELYANLAGASADFDDKCSRGAEVASAPTSSRASTSISLYVFDPADFSPRPSACAPSSWDAVSVGPHAARLLVGAVADLRRSVRRRGGELLVRTGDPAVIVPDVAGQVRASEVWWHEEAGSYEDRISNMVRERLLLPGEGGAKDGAIKVVTKVGCTLYHPDDLPYGLDEWRRVAHPNQTIGKKRTKKTRCTARTKSTHEHAKLQKAPELPENSPRNEDGLGSDNGASNNRARTEGIGNDGDDEMGADEPSMTRLLQHRRHCSVVDVSHRRLAGMPSIMGDFRRAARTHAAVRPCLPAPNQLIQPPRFDRLGGSATLDPGEIPTLEELVRPLLVASEGEPPSLHRRPLLGLDRGTISDVVRAALFLDKSSGAPRGDESSSPLRPPPPPVGGELAAVERLNHFVHSGRAAVANRSLADVVSNDDSSQLSRHLSMGTISPRLVYEAATSAGQESLWLVSHMEMRDFFLYSAFASGSRLFRREGTPVTGRKKARGRSLCKWRDPCVDASALIQWRRWAGGDTGLPLVDAALRELAATGYCSNRARQNAASVLAKDLEIDWRAGAELFQFFLDDHCVAANWGNWAYFSGVGADPKTRHFRTVSQAVRYDADGTYVRRWLPQLRNSGTGSEALFRPWDFAVDWPVPIVDPVTQYTWVDLKRLEATGKLGSGTEQVKRAEKHNQL